MTDPTLSLDLAAVSDAYANAGLSPIDLVREVLRRIDACDDRSIWIHRVPEADLLARAEALAKAGPERLPLFGVPFAIKDNIDAAGMPTTAACPAFAYVADAGNPAVAALEAAGAILVGKTNLDQFATGLVGVRSPYGACRNSFSPDHVSGGSSSGSAVAVARGLVSFALGTDTAGSGRVPAGFNNIIGLKASKGALSTTGVVPACRSLDCVSIFALTVADATAVMDVAAVFDPADPFSRPVPGPVGAIGNPPGSFTFAVPDAAGLRFFGDPDTPRLFEAACARLQALGGRRTEIDYGPFDETAKLLYEGPWVGERYAAIRDFIETQPDQVHPTVRTIIEGARRFSAADAFAGYYRLKALQRVCHEALAAVDLMVVPTAPLLPTIAAVEADPIGLNAKLGTYTNYMNLLDLCGLAVPAGFQPDGLPFGITLVAPAWQEGSLAALGAAFHADQALPLGAAA